MSDIENLVGESLGYVGEFVYQLNETDAQITLNITAPVAGGDMVVTLASDTPAVASVPDTITFPDGCNYAMDVNLALHAVGTTIISASCRGKTVETLIEVIPPELQVVSIDPPFVRVKPGDDVDVTITMSEEVVRDTAITLHAQQRQVDVPGALVIPRGKRSGTFRIHARDWVDESRPMMIRWRNNTMGLPMNNAV